MLEILFFIGWIWVVLLFFYKQSVCEFRLNQVDMDAGSDALEDVWKENVPVVVRKMAPLAVWTREDVRERACYSQLPVFREYGIREWIEGATSDTICPWKEEQAEAISRISHFHIWAERWVRSLFPSWYVSRYGCWAGRVGTFRTYAMRTCLFPVEGDILVTIMPRSTETFLPVAWKGGFPSEWTKKDTPFVGDIKYMDIILRPGMGLFLPPHWFVSWKEMDGSTLPMVCMAAYHTPISLVAFHMRK
jgi:hypothetical protein